MSYGLNEALFLTVNVFEPLPCSSLSFMSLSKTTPLPIKHDFCQQARPRRRAGTIQHARLCTLRSIVSQFYTVISCDQALENESE